MTPVHVFESHDEALHVWRAAGIRGATLVHVDAHHDLSWLDDEIHVHIGNYVCQALKDGVCSEVWWVVPDGALTARRSRVELGRQLRGLQRDYRRGGARAHQESPHTISLLGRRVVVCALGDLPVLDAPVLLDIDTDYFMTDGATFHTGFPAATPWILPAAVVERLRPILPRVATTTIAYSVEGGFTPLGWKFLADELAERLRPSPAPEVLRGFSRLRDAQRAIADGRYLQARQACDDAGCVAPAAAAFARARCAAAEARWDEARDARARTRRLDPSYATAYECGGFAALACGRMSDAEHAFAGRLQLDPRDLHAHAGLAIVAAERGRWCDVEVSARTAIAGGLDGPDVFRLLARALERQGRVDEAIGALKQSLKASLHGRATVHGPLASSQTSTRLPVHDTSHARTYAALARLEARAGRAAEAIAALRLAISAGYRDPSAHARLARLYSAQHRWRAAAAEVGRAIALLPESSERVLRRTWHGVAAKLEALA